MVTAAKQYEKHIRHAETSEAEATANGNERAARSYRDQAEFWRKQLAAHLARQTS